MKIFAPRMADCWGDNINHLWAAEYVKSKFPNYQINVDDSNTEGRYRDFINLNWINFELSEFDYYLYTHHRHIVKNRMNNDNVNRLFFDSSGLFIKFIMEDWYPTYNPTELILEQFAKLNLPEKYNVIHSSRNDSPNYDRRSKVNWKQFSEKYEKLCASTFMVSTGPCVDGCARDLSRLHALLKLYVMVKAQNIFVSHSGFTAIASMYRKRKNSFVLDSDNLLLTPPIHSYSNVSFTCDVKQAYYNMEKFNKSYYDYCLQNEMVTVTDNTGEIPNQFMEFPTIQKAPLNFTPQILYMNKENCPVADLKILKIYE